jgi:predicted DsbA family dithiol-disulfide isomerase
MSELLFKMYWLDGRDIGDFSVLSEAASDLGIPNALEYLKSEEDVDTIKKLESGNRVNSVPQFKINGR